VIVGKGEGEEFALAADSCTCLTRLFASALTWDEGEVDRRGECDGALVFWDWEV
jgi:hypothetical protein